MGLNSSWVLKKLGSIYDAIKIVNMHFRERLLKASNQSYALHAILTLDAFAYYINLSLIGNTFYTVESLFSEDLQERSISFEANQILPMNMKKEAKDLSRFYTIMA